MSASLAVMGHIASIKPSEGIQQHIPTLDGWRGVAILMVLADHMQMGMFGSTPWTGSIGQHGVAIFFVLSGYLITRKLRDEFLATGALNLKRFYRRRFFRLMPAAWTYLLIIGLAARSSSVAVHPQTLWASLCFYRNYIDGGHAAFLTSHFWSLSLEEQFYLFWPVTLVLLGFNRSRYTAISLAIFIGGYRFSHRAALLSLPVAATFRTEFRADSLLIGCVAALLLPAVSRYFRSWIIWPLILLLGLCICRYDQLIPAGESAMIALLLHTTSLHRKSLPSRFLEWKPLAYIGVISYSIYLWQQPFLCSQFHGLSTAALRLALVFCVAILSYYCLERPLIRWGRKLEPKRAGAEIVHAL